jgi:hypothetical protein
VLGGILFAILVAFVAWPSLRQAASGLPAEVESLDVGPTGQHVGEKPERAFAWAVRRVL